MLCRENSELMTLVGTAVDDDRLVLSEGTAVWLGLASCGECEYEKYTQKKRSRGTNLIRIDSENSLCEFMEELNNPKYKGDCEGCLAISARWGEERSE